MYESANDQEMTMFKYLLAAVAVVASAGKIVCLFVYVLLVFVCLFWIVFYQLVSLFALSSFSLSACPCLSFPNKARVSVICIVGANSCYQCSNAREYSVDANESPKLHALLQALMVNHNEGCADNIESDVQECDGDQICYLARASMNLKLTNEGKGHLRASSGRTHIT